MLFIVLHGLDMITAWFSVVIESARGAGCKGSRLSFNSMKSKQSLTRLMARDAASFGMFVECCSDCTSGKVLKPGIVS